MTTRRWTSRPVKAYSIPEVLTNVARHFEVYRCDVRLRQPTALELEIVDDGRGTAADASPGVGLPRCADVAWTLRRSAREGIVVRRRPPCEIDPRTERPGGGA
jgi:hypothetical protein